MCGRKINPQTYNSRPNKCCFTDKHFCLYSETHETPSDKKMDLEVYCYYVPTVWFALRLLGFMSKLHIFFMLKAALIVSCSPDDKLSFTSLI